MARASARPKPTEAVPTRQLGNLLAPGLNPVGICIEGGGAGADLPRDVGHHGRRGHLGRLQNAARMAHGAQ
jgi:hypothetical protein